MNLFNPSGITALTILLFFSCYQQVGISDLKYIFLLMDHRSEWIPDWPGIRSSFRHIQLLCKVLVLSVEQCNKDNSCNLNFQNWSFHLICRTNDAIVVFQRAHFSSFTDPVSWRTQPQSTLGISSAVSHRRRSTYSTTHTDIQH